MDTYNSSLMCCGRPFANPMALAQHRAAVHGNNLGFSTVEQGVILEEVNVEDQEIVTIEVISGQVQTDGTLIIIGVDPKFGCACGFRFTEKVRICPYCDEYFDWENRHAIR